MKKKIIVDYKNVPDEVLQALSEKYPFGYNKAIIKFVNAKKELVSAVPIEVNDISYLVKVSSQLQKMVDNIEEDDSDDDFDDVVSKEIPSGVGNDFDDFDQEDDSSSNSYDDDYDDADEEDEDDE
ncbi:MAG: DNA primase [Chitinophagales bacterium]|nr:DNA primase [Chitinophagales bacterium]